MAKLEIDVPLFKRCCFCLPMRWGLFALGALKLYSLLMLASVILMDFTDSPLVWFNVLEIVFNILLIAAAIMQRERLYHIYYKCAIVELVLIMILFVIVQVKSWQFWSTNHSEREANQEFLGFVIGDSVMILAFLVQGYLTLLVRSALIEVRVAAPSTANTVEVESQNSVGKSVEV